MNSNLFMVFIGGLCAVTGLYGLYWDDASLFLGLAILWGGLLVGYYGRGE